MPAFRSAFSVLQKIGKCMMLPVSVLPVAGILLGVGSANLWCCRTPSQVMAASGSAIFGICRCSSPSTSRLGSPTTTVCPLAATVGYRPARGDDSPSSLAWRLT
jgi:PTS system glucose-specific IIC component